MLIKAYETQKFNNDKIILAPFTIDHIILSKKFPCFIPALYLHAATTGTELSFTIHGYPTQLTCVDNQNPFQQQESFEQCYKNAMQKFISSPGYLYCLGVLHECENTLIELGMIKKIGEKQYLHGENGFVSVEKLIFDRLRETNQSGYFLLCLVQSYFFNQK